VHNRTNRLRPKGVQSAPAAPLTLASEFFNCILLMLLTSSCPLLQSYGQMWNFKKAQKNHHFPRHPNINLPQPFPTNLYITIFISFFRTLSVCTCVCKQNSFVAGQFDQKLDPFSKFSKSPNSPKTHTKHPNPRSPHTNPTTASMGANQSRTATGPRPHQRTGILKEPTYGLNAACQRPT
jgi:hypothetical protein